MKLKILLITVFATQINLAQNIFPATGNVGIGTNSPSALLQVHNGNNSYGTILATANEYNFSLYAKTLITHPINTESFRLGLKYTADENNGFISFYRGESTAGGFLGFSTNGIERIRISRTGNVGIGTDNPIAPLTVYGRSRFFPRRTGDGDARSLEITYTQSNPSFVSNDYPVIVQTGGGDQPLILDAARIGIGTTNPSSKLTVVGTIKSYEPLALGTTVNSFQLINEMSGNVGENSIINRLWTYRDLTSNNWYNSRIHDGISIDDSFKTPHADTRTWWERDPYDNIQSWGNANETYLTINKGNVGIGTTTTGSHKLAVEGSVGAREVKVYTTAWSDFVFKKEYNLPTLEEVEKHIKEKGHLENIPSEKEVLENGINLGEMNAKLLQKIEELTLYSIDQNKKINEQSKEIETLKDLVVRVSKIENEMVRK
ncbi:hypothetical protein [Flavobacterium gyeonganense]|uniref:Peptidase S74 domain-containing protein n=1 Tax=Flavobacterium gyeonganense TaxID=1310418 RepID=A0ABV5HEM2_9FLAO|nr:hypothetical protein [Flavobacterium gyeonganense]